MGLSEQMIEVLGAHPKVNDYDQRSAIGMARSWVENREPIRWKVEQVQYENRDNLAKALVVIMEMNPAEPEEYVEALKAVRMVVNAPFQRKSVHVGASLMKPGAAKKAKE